MWRACLPPTHQRLCTGAATTATAATTIRPPYPAVLSLPARGAAIFLQSYRAARVGCCAWLCCCCAQATQRPQQARAHEAPGSRHPFWRQASIQQRAIRVQAARSSPRSQQPALDLGAEGRGGGGGARTGHPGGTRLHGRQCHAHDAPSSEQVPVRGCCAAPAHFPVAPTPLHQLRTRPGSRRPRRRRGRPAAADLDACSGGFSCMAGLLVRACVNLQFQAACAAGYTPACGRGGAGRARGGVPLGGRFALGERKLKLSGVQRVIQKAVAWRGRAALPRGTPPGRAGRCNTDANAQP